MKKIAAGIFPLMLILVSCSGEEEVQTTDNEEPDVELSFEDGGAETAEEYFNGVLGQVKQVDVKLRYIFDLDDMNASMDSINTELDSMITLIKKAREVLKYYETKDWPKRKKFQNLTLQWFEGVEGLVNDHFYNLAEPMSRPDNTWTEEDITLYKDYEVEYYEFFEIDQQWVDFQKVFADANDIKLADEEPDL